MPIPPEWTLSNSTQIANLWSGYGSISRRTYTTPSSTITTILKHISAPQSQVYSESHTRKMLSYSIERNFYTHLAPLLSEAKSCHVARVYQVSSGAIEMEDLSEKFPIERGTLGMEETIVVVEALAEFHALFWGFEWPTVPPPSPSSAANVGKAIWEEGSYWYLRTRSTELSSLSKDWQDIARLIEHKIRIIPQSHRTIIHGDLKSANIVFSSTLKSCAFYDLQYVGYGPGVRDLAKFFISSVRNLDDESEDRLLRLYYDKLSQILNEKGVMAAGYTLEICRYHYELCLVDFWRFMLGWVGALFLSPYMVAYRVQSNMMLKLQCDVFEMC